MRKSPNPARMTSGEVAHALGVTQDWIRKLRRNPDSHPFFRKAFKIGSGTNSPLLWHRADVDEYLRETSGRGIDGAA